MQEPLDVKRYVGKWYELMHYGCESAWFQTNDDYNTTATYELTSPTTMSVVNTTWSGGQSFTSKGTGKYLGGISFRVDFPIPEVVKLEMSGQFGMKPPEMDQEDVTPNYIVKTTMSSQDGSYMFAIVVNSDESMLWVLSRTPEPSKIYYDYLMKHMVENYDKRKLIQTPHYK